jgi:hypothetical protein
MTQKKKAYTTPQLTVHGDVEVLTQGNKTPVTSLDAPFPVNTPFKNLTWS